MFYFDDEVSVEGNGLILFSGGSNGECVFFGLVGIMLLVDGNVVDGVDGKMFLVLFFDLVCEIFFEYDIVKLMYEFNEM